MSKSKSKVANNNIEITFAVMSDLHCHHSKSFPKDATGKSFEIDTYLLSDRLRTPAKEHPIESLCELIKAEPLLKADFLLCPGDITNKVDTQGFITGWEFIQQVASALSIKNENVLATLGNHDVDSRYTISNDVFDQARGIKRNFPLENPQLRSNFWDHGFAFYEQTDLRIFVFNSCFFHKKKDHAVYGMIDSSQIEEIDKYLSSHTDDKVKVALFHHHPIPHSRFNLGNEDLIRNGSDLIDLLNKYSFDLVIHGHKHDPWLRYASGNNLSVPIFSAGSFSATTNILITGKKNNFHLIKIIKSKKNTTGIIDTWEFLPAGGWVPASGEHNFPVKTGFGYRGSIEDLIKKTVATVAKAPNKQISWNVFIKQIPEVEFLTPDDCIKFKTALENEHKLMTHPSLPKLPIYIGEIYSGN
jgi:3',5'-cyclic AMP phosphodiesterase CpdA